MTRPIFRPIHTLTDRYRRGMLVVPLARCFTSITSIFLSGQRFGRDDVVGLYPSRRTNCETRLRTRGEVSSRLVVSAQISRLCRSEICLCEIALAPIGHCELSESEWRFGFPPHGGAQNRNR